MARYNPHYRRPPGKEPSYSLGARRALVAEREYRFSLYEVDVVVSNGLSGRHVLAVPVAISAVSLTVGVLLTEEDSLIRLSQVYNGVFVREGHPLLGRTRTRTEIENYPVVTSSLSESRQQRFFDEHWRPARGETSFGQENHVFGSNSISACIDYLTHTDAFLRISNVIAPYFAERGIAEVSQSGPLSMIPMGIYVLAERRGEARLETLLTALTAASQATLPPPRD